MSNNIYIRVAQCMLPSICDSIMSIIVYPSYVCIQQLETAYKLPRLSVSGKGFHWVAAL